MIKILTGKNGYKILDRGWNIGTFKTVKELRKYLIQIENMRYKYRFERILNLI